MNRLIWIFLFGLSLNLAQGKNFRVPVDPQAQVRSKYHHRERGGITVGKDFVLGLTSRGWLVKSSLDGKVLWRINSDCSPVTGIIFNDSNLYYACAEGILMARSLDTGKLVWQFKYQDAVASLPSFSADKSVLVFQTGSGRIFCLNSSDGSLKWLSRQQGRSRLSLFGASQPLILDDEVYIGMVDGILVVLKMDDGSMIRTYEVFNRPIVSDLDYSLIADQDNLYASSLNGMCALSRHSGKKFWCVNQDLAGELADDDQYLYAVNKEKELLIIEKITGLIEKKIQIPKSALKKFKPEKIILLEKNNKNLIVISNRGAWKINPENEEVKQILKFTNPIRAGKIYKRNLFLLSSKGFLISRELGE